MDIQKLITDHPVRTGVLVLFLVGMGAIAWLFCRGLIHVNDFAEFTILWFTGTAVVWTTYETARLRQTEVQGLLYEKTPLVIASYDDRNLNTIILKNIGRGPAKFVRWEIIDRERSVELTGPTKTVIAPNEGHTRIQREEYEALNPINRQRSPYRIVIYYEDFDGNPYVTVLVSGNSYDDYTVAYYGRQEGIKLEDYV